MIYLVTNDKNLNLPFKTLPIKDSIKMIESWEVVQVDSETNGLNPILCDLICFQFGNREADTQIVVDCNSVSILEYKEILETKYLIGHNLKFDIKMLFKYGIIPTDIYDTMVSEQMLHLGFSRATFKYNLKNVSERYLNISMDKEIRSQIASRGLDKYVVMYAANDVVYLEDIRDKQLVKMKKQKCKLGLEIENSFIIPCAYLEWCGIRLDSDKWKIKIKKLQEDVEYYENELNQFVIDLYKQDYKTYGSFVDTQLDLFNPNNSITCTINWASSKQVIAISNLLGFDTKTKSKTTGKVSDSVKAELLQKQKNINPKFVEIYVKFKNSEHNLKTFGQTFLDSLNPDTGKLYTNFYSIGTTSGRMASGHGTDEDLAKYKQLPPKSCKNINAQNLPHDAFTRSCFIAGKDRVWISADFSAIESRLGAEIYNEPEMLKEFNEGSGDVHSLCASLVFHEELKGIPVKDIAKVRPDLRQKVKAIEFDLLRFGLL